ncbi:MAG: hypothetical protein ACJ79S_18620 [Gemmatimonadaceae bacterium]
MIRNVLGDARATGVTRVTSADARSAAWRAERLAGRVLRHACRAHLSTRRLPAGASVPPSRRPLAAPILTALAAIAAIGGGRALHAQVLSLPKRSPDPAYWASLDVGYTQRGDVVDGATASAWRFGDAAQYRAALEYAVARGTSVGVSGSWARMPLRYELLDGGTGPAGQASFDAHADVSSLAASLHVGGGTTGFHAVIDANVGATLYSHFRDDATGTPLRPRSDTDFSFGVGTGFGYSTGARNEFFLVQDWSNAIHQRTGLRNDARTNVQQLTTRLGARFGLGKRRGRA